MSVKSASFVAAAAAALSVTPGASVVESVLDNMVLNGLKIAELSDGSRKCIVFAGVKVGEVTTFRPVADPGGNVRLYTDVTSAAALAKRANLGEGDVQYVKVVPAGSVGDPVAKLKAQHKQIVSEDVKAGTTRDALDTKITAAIALGWDVAENTPEADEYDDLVLRRAAVNEWKTVVAARRTVLADALTAAGIDPVTYLPIPDPN